MARPETDPGMAGEEGDGRPAEPTSAAVGTGPGTGVVRPGTGVVRPGTGVVGSADAGAKARASVPETPEVPLGPLRIVLPVIPVKPAKQGFLDRLVAPKKPKPPKTQTGTKKRDGKQKGDKGRRDEGHREVPVSPAVSLPPVDGSRQSTATAPAPSKAPPTAPKSAPPAKAVSPTSAPPAGPATAPSKQPPKPAPPKPAPARSKPAMPAASMPALSPPAPLSRPTQRPAARLAPAPERLSRPLRRLADAYGDDWPVLDEPARLRPPLRWVVASIAAVVVATGGGAVVGVRGTPPPPQWLAATLPAAAAPYLSEVGALAPAPTAAGLAARLAGLFDGAGLGAHVTGSVIDVATGEQVWGRDPGGAAVPASAAKLLTAAAVLQARGPAYQISTRAVAGGAPGEVVLIGGGDPTLAAGETTSYPGAARLDLLAEQVLSSLGGQVPTRVIVDSSLYTGPTYPIPQWYEADRNSGFIANVTALMTDGARKNPADVEGGAARYSEPDLAAGEQFAAALGLPASAVARAVAPAQAQPLGEVLSPPIGRIVELMLARSDNLLAEGMARQVAIARDEPASFDGAADATRAVLTELGLPVRGYTVVDGSGLSHFNRASAQLLAAVVALAASPEQPQLRSIISGLPVAGYSGTLDERFRSSAGGGSAAGTVRAKTGTLTGVNTLAGIVVDADGRLLAFSVIADKAGDSRAAAERALDRIAAAITACGCS